MGFYGSYDPTNSVKALKEVVVLRIGFNLTRSTSPCYNATHACNNTYTKMNLKQSEMGPVRQNPIQRTVSSVDMCVHWSVHNCCAQYCTEQTWQFSLLPSRQSPLLWWCLFEGRGWGTVSGRDERNPNTKLKTSQRDRASSAAVVTSCVTGNCTGSCAVVKDSQSGKTTSTVNRGHWK